MADSFLSMQKKTCAGGGSMMWHEIVTAMADRNGHAGKQAERQGKRKLIAADDNMMAAIRKVSA